VQALIRHNLIDGYRIHVHPIVLGGGTQLFPQGGVSATVGLTGTRTLDSGVVSLTYVPAGQDARPADEDLSDT
jgi:dihydrofolate reductase